MADQKYFLRIVRKSNVPIQFILSEKTLDENLFGLGNARLRLIMMRIAQSKGRQP